MGDSTPARADNTITSDRVDEILAELRQCERKATSPMGARERGGSTWRTASIGAVLSLLGYRERLPSRTALVETETRTP